jgi:hypothetical protein
MTEQEAVEKIFGAEKPEDILKIFDELPRMDDDEKFSVIASGFRVLKEMQYENFLLLALQYCHKLPESPSHWLTVYISDWLDELPHSEMLSKRKEVIEFILAELSPHNEAERISVS